MKGAAISVLAPNLDGLADCLHKNSRRIRSAQGSIRTVGIRSEFVQQQVICSEDVEGKSQACPSSSVTSNGGRWRHSSSSKPVTEEPVIAVACSLFQQRSDRFDSFFDSTS